MFYFYRSQEADEKPGTSAKSPTKSESQLKVLGYFSMQLKEWYRLHLIERFFAFQKQGGWIDFQ